jgi:hypothetical protein
VTILCVHGNVLRTKHSPVTAYRQAIQKTPQRLARSARCRSWESPKTGRTGQARISAVPDRMSPAAWEVTAARLNRDLNESVNLVL